MPKYNLNALGPEEFERMCQSLVQEVIGPGAKIYGIGRDGARDATFHGSACYPSTQERWDGDWIFQVKFHDVEQIGPGNARVQLIKDLDAELSAITEKYQNACDNYILMTNVSLTPVYQRGTKDKIDLEVVPRYTQSLEHIHVWGAEEICRFLDAHPGIRQSFGHFLVAGDVIARLLGLSTGEDTSLAEVVKLYCEGCFVHEKYAVLDDAGDVEDERIALQRVFVDLDVKPPALPGDVEVLKALRTLPSWLEQAAQDEERVSALSYLLDDSIPGLILIGAPGGGKSTLGQYLAQIHRARLIGRLEELAHDNKDDLEGCTPHACRLESFFGTMLSGYRRKMARTVCSIISLSRSSANLAGQSVQMRSTP